MSTTGPHTKKSGSTAAKKTSRIAKKASTMPFKGTIVVSGKSSDDITKTFRFSVLYATKQLKERNKAYNFFSID